MKNHILVMQSHLLSYRTLCLVCNWRHFVWVERIQQQKKENFEFSVDFLFSTVSQFSLTDLVVMENFDFFVFAHSFLPLCSLPLCPMVRVYLPLQFVVSGCFFFLIGRHIYNYYFHQISLLSCALVFLLNTFCSHKYLAVVWIIQQNGGHAFPVVFTRSYCEYHFEILLWNCHLLWR